MKTVAKKVIGLTISFIFIVLACTMTVDSKDVMAGAGRGENAQISTITQFSELLGDIFGSEEALAPLALEEKTYSSLTFHEFTTMSVRGATSFSMKRDLTGYLTDEISFYQSEMSMSFSVTVDKEKRSAEIYLEMELYIDRTQAFFRIKRYLAGGSGEYQNFPLALLDTWIDCSDEEEMLSALREIGDYNSSVSAYLARFIDRNFEEAFSRRENVYTLRESEFKQLMKDFEREILSQYGLKAALSGELSVDLSEPDAPKMILTDGNLWDELTFRNIDNTVVSLPAQMDIVSAEDLLKEME